MRKLPWSDAEIACDYRTAADPEAQIKILAELNATDEDTIRAALAREGITVPARRGRRKKQPDAAAGVAAPGAQEPHEEPTETEAAQPDGDLLPEIPQSEIKNVFLSILAVLEAVPKWATKYTRDRAAELADAIMRDFLHAWKLSWDQEPQNEERSEGP